MMMTRDNHSSPAVLNELKAPNESIKINQIADTKPRALENKTPEHRTQCSKSDTLSVDTKLPYSVTSPPTSAPSSPLQFYIGNNSERDKRLITKYSTDLVGLNTMKTIISLLLCMVSITRLISSLISSY